MLNTIKQCLLKASLVTVGIVTVYGLASTEALARGQLDITFDGDGVKKVIMPSVNSAVTAFHVYPDNRMLLGAVDDRPNGFEIEMARLLPDGNFEPYFGNNTGRIGYSQTSIPAMPDVFINDFAVDVHRNIVSVGQASNYTNGYVFKFDRAGSPITSFGTNGQYALSTHTRVLPNYAIEVKGVAIQKDNKILITGKMEDASQSVFKTFVMRLHGNGQPDISFGAMADGLVFLPNPYTLPVFGEEIKVTDSGNIYVTSSYLVAKLDTHGLLDTSFNGSGFAYTIPASGLPFTSGQIAVDHEENVYFLSILTSTSVAVDRCSIVKYLPSGAKDGLFGVNGEVTLIPPAGDKYNCGDIALASEGGIVVSALGDFLPWTNTTTSGTPYIFRLDAFGNMETSFGTQGITQLTSPQIPNPVHHGIIWDNVFLTTDSDNNVRFAMSEYFYTKPGMQYVTGKLVDNNDVATLTPNNFPSKGSQPQYSWVVSDPVQVSGLHADAAVAVQVSNGQYSINGGTFTTELGHVKNGDTIHLRNMTGSGIGFSATTTLTVGGRPDRKHAGVIKGNTQTYDFLIAISPLVTDPIDPDPGGPVGPLTP